MLKTYYDNIRQQNIPYYWNKENNLIGCLKPSTMTDVANTLKNIIEDVEKNLNSYPINPLVLGNYIRKYFFHLKMSTNTVETSE